MEIDVYQQCPCHEDKKIKFCCGKDVVDDLNLVLAKTEAGQYESALARMEKAIEKSGPKDCLVTLKTHILITTGQLVEARAANSQFLEKHPSHTTGLQHRALIELGEGNIDAAVHSMQDSMDSMTGDRIPVSVANAFRLFGIALASQGNVISSRAHINFAGSLKPDDRQLQEILFHTYRIPELPMMLRKSFQLPPAPEDQKDEDWANKYDSIFRVMQRGQFRKALRGLNRLNEIQPGRVEVETSIAILTCVMCNRDEMSPAWRAIAENESASYWDRVEAESMAQLLETAPLAGTCDIKRHSFELDSVDDAVAAAIASPQMVKTQTPPEDIFGEGPPPRAAFVFLDRPELKDAAELSVDNVPSVAGELLVYGKQTDRPARIECVSTDNGNIAPLNEAVKQLAGVAGKDPEETLLGQADKGNIALTFNWHLPKGVSPKQHTELVDKYRQSAVMEKWSSLSFACLDGKTPRDAAKDEKLKLPLDAMLLNLEQSADAQISGKPISQSLRDDLGVGNLPNVDPSELGSATPISPVRQQYLDFAALSDDQVIQVHSEAIALGNVPVLRKIVPQMIERESLHAKIPLDISYSMMAELTLDNDEALDLLSRARTLAKERGQPIGGLLVQEFEQRMSRGLTEKLSPLLERIQRNHMKEPNVEVQLARVFRRFGLIDDEGRPVAPPGGGGVGGGENDTGIWTPDSTDEPAGAEEKSESKLWLPD